MSKNYSAAHPKMLPSTQLFMVGALVEGIALVMLAIALFVSLGSPSAIIATFLTCSVLGIIASALAMILAVVGMIRYRRMFGWNLALLLVSIIFNPIIWLGLLFFMG